MSNYPVVSKVHRLNEENFIGVDQTSSNEDRTCLCFGRLEDDGIVIEKIEYTEKQHDMDKYIDEISEKIYGVFGISNLNDK